MNNLRYFALMPLVVVLPIIFLSIFSAASEYFAPVIISASYGILILSLVLFYYFSGYKYATIVSVVQGVLGIALTIIISIVDYLNIPIEIGAFYSGSETSAFYTNIAIIFSLFYIILILYPRLPHGRFIINSLLGVIFFSCVLSMWSALFDFDLQNSETVAVIVLPIPALLSFLILAAVIFAGTNHMRKLYLSPNILISFMVLFITLIVITTVVYENIRRENSINFEISTYSDALENIAAITSVVSGTRQHLKDHIADQDKNHLNSYLFDKSSIITSESEKLVITTTTFKSEVARDTALAIRSEANRLFSAASIYKDSDEAVVVPDFYYLNFTDNLDSTAGVVKLAKKDFQNEVSVLERAASRTRTDTIIGVSVASTLSIITLPFILLFIRQYVRRLHETQIDLRTNYLHLAEEKARAEAILSSIADGVVVIDKQQKVTLFNKAAENLLQIQEKDIIGKYFSDIKNIHFAENLPASKRSFLKKALAGLTVSVPRGITLSRDTRSIIDIDLSASPIINSQKASIGAIVTFRDRTDEHILESAKDEFVSLASHQLRTPATATKQFLAMFLQGYAGELDERQKLYIQQAYDNNELGIAIIEELLVVARLESQHTKVKKVEVDLVSFIERLAKLHQPAADAAHQKLIVDVPDGTVFKKIDTSLIGMVIDNLVSNALKYSNDGATINVKLYEEEGAMIEIRDTGIGIKKEDMSKLFGKFERLEDPQKQDVNGTGLGLYLVHKIVKLHGAHLSVTSEYGKGTTFILKI